MSSRNKSTTGSTRKVLSPKKESHALHENELKSVYLTVFQSTKEEITTQDELLLLLQYAGCNPSKKVLQKFWGPKTDSISFQQFCSIVDQVSQTSKQDLLKAFRKIDVNGDGFITHDELFKVLTKRGERMTKQEVKTMIEDADCNGDSKLDYHEFCALMDSTISKCKKLYSTSTYENENERSTKSSKSRTSLIESSVSKTPPAKQSAFSKSQFDEKRSSSLESIKENTSRSQDRKKQSITSKLSMKKEEEKLHLKYEKLTSEPPDLNRWHFHSIKGSFYKEDDGIIESHSYELKIMQPTRLWMSVKTIAPKYGKFYNNILNIDTTIYLLDNQSRLVAFSNSIVEDRSCLQCEVDIGVYTVYVFSSGAQLLSDSSGSGELTIVKGSGDEARLTKACKDTLMEIFYRCDLNGNGYLSREEFDIFQKRTSGEECDDAAWQVVQENCDVTPQMELTPRGFIELNLMEACDPEGGQDELWVTLESMGYSRTLQLAKGCPFQLEVFTKQSDHEVSAVDVSGVNKELEQALHESISMISKKTLIKNKKDLILHVAEFDQRISLAIENQSHKAVSVIVDCNGSENLMSDKGSLRHSVDVEPKTVKVIHHLVPENKNHGVKLDHKETISS